MLRANVAREDTTEKARGCQVAGWWCFLGQSCCRVLWVGLGSEAVLRHMIFSKKNAGKWVASKGEKVIATGKTLTSVMRTVEARKDKAAIRFDLVPKVSVR